MAVSDEAETAKKVPKLALANGVEIPMVGFGTAFFPGDFRRPELIWQHLPEALRAGYRHIDSAVMYGNERQVGTVLGHFFMEGRLTREDVWVTTKVGHPPSIHFPDSRTDYVFRDDLSAFDGVMNEAVSSLSNLGFGYVDLMLLHWPGPFKGQHLYAKDSPLYEDASVPKDVARRKRREMWAALENLYERKFVRAIGVSNFTREHLEDILPDCKVRPMMNQIEIHPYLAQTDMVEYCQTEGIQVTAYSPLAAGKAAVVEDPVVVELATKKGVSPGRLVLSWLVQRGIVVIPKSSSPKRMAENIQVSSDLLSPEEMSAISSLDKRLFTCPNPADIA